MTPDHPAAVDILRRAMVARIATLSRNRRPHINPIYFVYVDGRIYLGTSDRTLAALNVKADPRVAILLNVELQPDDRRVLRIHGCATVHTDAEMCRSYVRRIVRKYFVSWRGIWNTLTHARLLPLMQRYNSSGEKGCRCVLEVFPERAELVSAPEGVW